MEETATLTLNGPARTTASTSKLAFARHYGEMVLVMFAGMVVLGGLAELAFAAAGTSLTAQSGAVQVTLMGISMTVPMVAWMAYRGHTTSQNAEMAGSMVVPTAIAAALALSGAGGSEAALTLQHGVMLPAMLGVMLWRYSEYAQRH